MKISVSLSSGLSVGSHCMAESVASPRATHLVGLSLSLRPWEYQVSPVIHRLREFMPTATVVTSPCRQILEPVTYSIQQTIVCLLCFNATFEASCG